MNYRAPKIVSIQRSVAGVIIALGVAACGSTAATGVVATNTPSAAAATPAAKLVVKAAYPDACTAEAFGKAGKWTLAETAWGNAETEASKDLGATFAFASVALDTVSPALDQSLSQPISATDVATYNRDLTAAGKYITGC
jgi:hypothetical protein